MIEYEARYRKFVSMGDFSVLNEKVFGPFRVKHLAYLFFSIMLVWSGLRGSTPSLVLGAVMGLLSLLSATLSIGSMSLEAKASLLILSLLDLLLQPRERGSLSEASASLQR